MSDPRSGAGLFRETSEWTVVVFDRGELARIDELLAAFY
jgi:hypothetical protein